MLARECTTAGPVSRKRAANGTDAHLVLNLAPAGVPPAGLCRGAGKPDGRPGHAPSSSEGEASAYPSA